MHSEIESALKGHGADYIEIRIEESEASRIQYHDRMIEDVGRTTSLGGNVRALVKGGWGFVSFNSLENLREKVALAIRQARLVGQEESQLAPIEPVVDTVEIEVKHPPSSIPLAQKKQILDEYNDLIWSTPKIQTSSLGYGDGRKKVIFASSEGSYIEQIKPDVTLRLAVVARDGSDVQQAHLSLGSKGEFGLVEGLHDQVQKMAQRAVELLAAPQVKGGEYTVVCDPVLAGVFAHEAFGHLSESDFVYENDKMREIMVLGRRFGGKHLNIVDGAAVPGLRGSYKYDDEGTPASRTYLVREGVLVGRLHSRETAARMGEKPTGNARALDYRYQPIVRMTNTLIEPDGTLFEDMISEIKEGVYAKNWYGGMTSMEMFTFSAGEAYMIRNGKIAELLRPVVLTGNVFTTLENIDAIGNDLEMNEGGGCGKGGQMPLPVSNGSPHIRIRRCLVGGR
ncbi:MAG: TldD/PmbA family protein [Chloroflexi bacterium CG07_land_8_20_14_0_80_51_10]|nr:MAG: TldD/PmbA family protein [Chloroflexi bacterium CG07_land_8_20_14_0_80_51_10]